MNTRPHQQPRLPTSPRPNSSFCSSCGSSFDDFFLLFLYTLIYTGKHTNTILTSGDCALHHVLLECELSPALRTVKEFIYNVFLCWALLVEKEIQLLNQMIGGKWYQASFRSEGADCLDRRRYDELVIANFYKHRKCQ